MSGAYRRHQSLVRFFRSSSSYRKTSFFAHTWCSTFYWLIRLEERGWLVSRAHPSTSSSEGAGGKGTSVVVVKTGKKRMDHERYLDATQRYVRRRRPTHHLIPISNLPSPFPPPPFPFPCISLLISAPARVINSRFMKGESSRP